jgi:hypothetical protein
LKWAWAWLEILEAQAQAAGPSLGFGVIFVKILSEFRYELEMIKQNLNVR